MAFATSFHHRRHTQPSMARGGFGRNTNTRNKRVSVLTTTPPITRGSTPRLQKNGAEEYGDLLTTELQQNAPRSLAAAVITLGETEKDIAAESSYYDACADAFVHTKLRELMTALLSGLCGVPHPNSALPDGLYPRTHFITWLHGAFPLGTKVFEPQPQTDINPLQPESDLCENIGNTVSPETGKCSRPAPALSTLAPTASITGKASELRFRQILIMFDTLGELAPQANEVVHSLTISDVARVLLHPSTSVRIESEPLECLVVLVESIIGCTIQDVTLDWDSPLARKQFKAAARNFRKKIPDTLLLTKIEKDWKEKWQEARAEDLMQDLINRKMVVRMEEHEVVKTELADVKKELADVKNELVETKKELVETKKELVKTKQELVETKSALIARMEKLEQQQQLMSARG